MLLALVAFPTLAMLAALGLIACAPKHEPGRYALPAVRTVALATAASIYVVALWKW